MFNHINYSDVEPQLGIGMSTNHIILYDYK